MFLIRWHFLFSLFLFFSVTSVAEKFERLVVFGDSLSDVGTYAEAAGNEGGGKFTTNPGFLWVENIAKNINLPMMAHVHEGFGKPPKKIGGFNYAQGGARIAAANENSAQFTARSVRYQIDNFLAENKEFKTTDLIFVQGGANDITAQLKDIIKKTTTPEQAIKDMVQLAAKFSNLLNAIKNEKGKNLVVISLPEIEKTPLIQSLDPLVQALVSEMVKTFNHALEKKLAVLDIFFIDFYTFDKSFNENYKNYGFENITQPACIMASLPEKSSLFCTSKTLITSTASERYKFADKLHPTTGFSKVTSDFIWNQIKNKFKLK